MRAPALPLAVSRRLRLLSYAVLAVLLGIAALVALATLPVLFGYHTYVVNGGSMEPNLKSGSVAVARATSPFALQVGDVIARRESQDGPAVLHRISRIDDDGTGRVLYTQGDANRTEDPEPVMLLGSGDKVIYSVPYVGHILNFGGSTRGNVLLLGVPLALLAVMSLYEKLQSRRRPGSRQPAAGAVEPPRALYVVPSSPSFQPVGEPTIVSLVGLPNLRVLMDAERTLKEFPAAQHASVIAYQDGTATLEVALRYPLPADEIVDELRSGTGYHIVIEEARPDEQRLRLRFVSPVVQQLTRAA